MSAQELRVLALSMPAAHEHQTWGRPTFRVGQRIYVGMDPDAGTATVKATKDAQQALIATDPTTYSPAPRVGRHGWVHVHLARADAHELRELVVEAWRLVAPSRLVTAWDGS